LARPSKVGILRVDHEGNCTAVSSGWLDMTGSLREEVVETGWLKALDPEDALAVAAAMGSPSHDEFSLEVRFNVPGGFAQHALCTGLPVLGAHGDIEAYLLAVSDPVRRADVQVADEDMARALKKRVRELQCLFEISRVVERTGGMSIPKIVEGWVQLLPGALRYPEIAYARIILDGRRYETSAVTDPAWKERVGIKVHGEAAGVVEVGYVEFPGCGIDRPLLEEESTLIRSVAQRLGRMAERIKDAERLQEKEEELRAKMTHLTRVAIAGQMAANIAHELNQPLTAITSYAEASRRILGQKRPDVKKLDEALAWIAEEALRAGEIIRHLRGLVRERQSLREEQDLNALIASIEHLASLYARLHNTQVSFDLAPDLPPVYADGVQIQQVALNLIRNGIDVASRSGRRGGRVVIRSRRPQEGEVQVSVEDDGRGLAKEDEEKVFSPFYTTKEDGMGLGLAISKSIVNEHGGRIWYTPGDRSGTVFHFTLPTHVPQ